MKRSRSPVSVRSGQIEFLKLNTEKWRWRDAYQWLLGLNWLLLAMFRTGNEVHPGLYLIRLLAFVLILIAIVDKNRLAKQ